jgi:hypothetical protein
VSDGYAAECGCIASGQAYICRGCLLQRYIVSHGDETVVSAIQTRDAIEIMLRYFDTGKVFVAQTFYQLGNGELMNCVYPDFFFGRNEFLFRNR